MTDTLTPQPAPSTKKHSFLSRLSTGTGAFNVLGPRNIYYRVAGIMLIASVLLIAFKQFNLGIEFAGGTKIQFAANTSQINTDEVGKTVAEAVSIDSATAQKIGDNSVQVRTEALSPEQIALAKTAIVDKFGVDAASVSASDVSETWGSEISSRALLALVVFLVLVSVFLALRYERRVAVGAVVSVLHDLIITAGIYSLVGFEVTPATVIGILTILGFSLYDTVVVYDKVRENTKGLTSLIRRNYLEAANLAVNQTLMRSINTSLIALLPVAGLLVAGVAILGSGTLKDLALVMLVGMIVAGYSSIFIAVPVAVDLKLREPLIKAHTARVAAKRKAEGVVVDADGDPISVRGVEAGAVTKVSHAESAALADGVLGGRGTGAPRPGVKPVRSSGKGATPTGKRGR
ncbi:protein translocase subunit SecF [Nakamurella silvestris]|nr:protein translocase subunit SecF [Nakamurella silvestris]